MKTIFFLFIMRLVLAYQDPELEKLWSEIPDIYHPRVEDFLLIQEYIAHGKRPYLEPLECDAKNETHHLRLRRIRDFKFLGPNQELPIFEVHTLNPSEETKSRCILIFASYNLKDRPYPEHARNLVNELAQLGYSGDVILRIGGFPNISQGSLKYSYVPYSFKVAFFQEAKSMGYKEILWVDSAMHPIRNLEFIFRRIEKDGFFFMSPGPSDPTYFLKEAADSLHIPQEFLKNIPHIQTGILGLNMSDLRVTWLLNGWQEETEKLLSSITFYPEELSLSFLAWRLGFKPTFFSGEIFCGGDELMGKDTFAKRPNLQFYFGSLMEDSKK